MQPHEGDEFDLDSMVRAADASTVSDPPRPRIYNRRDLEALEAEPLPLPTVEGLLSRGNIAIFYGAPKCGKSLVLAILIGMLLRGEGMFAGMFPVREQLSVIYNSTEGRRRFRFRFRAMADHLGLTKAEVARLTFIDNIMVNLISDDPTNNVNLFIDEIGDDPPGAIFYDTMTRVVQGKENETEEAAIALGNMDKIRDALGGDLLQGFLHHVNKGGSFRGNTSYLGAADAIIRFDHNIESGLRTMRSDGMKDEAEFDPIAFEIRRSAEDDNKRVFAVFTGTVDKPVKRSTKDDRAAVVAILREHAKGRDKAKSKTEIRALMEVPPPPRTLDRILEELHTNQNSVIQAALQPRKSGAVTRDVWCYWSDEVEGNPR